VIWPWLVHFTGLDYGAPYGRVVPYNFWSGVGAYLTILGTVGAIYRKHNCHRARCWRIGKHVINGTPWCNKHHEEVRKG
jgi:hypothetical protein